MGGVVDICNRALTKVGDDRITSLTDGTKAASVCNHAYEFVRDSVLRSSVWNCTVTRATLAPLSSTPDHTYKYEYQLPSECLKIVEVDTTYDWVVEGRKILTDEGTTLKIRYQQRVTDPNQYDSALFELIATTLAYEICETLTQSNTKKQIIGKDLERLTTMAKMHDAQEGSPSRLKQDSWIDARF